MGQLSSAVQVTNGRRYGAGRYRYNQPLRLPVLVLHTIEGSLSYDTARRHENPPHLWYSPSRRELFQTCDLLGHAFALRHPRGTPETNRRGPCLQVELEGFARDTRSWPNEYYANIAQDVVRPLDRFCRETYGATLVGGPTTRRLIYADELDPFGPLATTSSPLRLSPTEWNAAHGLIGHQHVPFNTHWDPGRFQMERMLRYLVDLDEPRVLRLLSGGQRLLRGTDVRDWQQLIADRGFLTADDVDGLFGPDTDAATRRFQEAAGLRVDGVVTAAVALAAVEFPVPVQQPVVTPDPPPAPSGPPTEPVIDVTDSPGSGDRLPTGTGQRETNDATSAGSLSAPPVAEPVIDVRPPDVAQKPWSNRLDPSAPSEPVIVPEAAPPVAAPNTEANTTAQPTTEPRPPSTTQPTPPTQPTPTTAEPAADRDEPSFFGRILAFLRRLFGGR